MPVRSSRLGVQASARRGEGDQSREALYARTDPVALVVDEDASVVRALATTLCSGFSVLRATSVADAKRWLRTAWRIDIAFVEHDLPDELGSAVLAELLRRHPRAARVLMSRCERAQLSPAVLDAAQLFLSKPLDLGVVRSVQGAVGSARQLNS
jgi:DNA-binding NtrC family response regulator